MAAGSGSNIIIAIKTIGQAEASKDLRALAQNTRDLGDSSKNILKPTVALVALGFAAQGAAAAGAGVVGLVSGLAPLAGVAVSGAAGMIALKSATGLVKVAGMGLSESFKGVFDEFQRSTPATNALAGQVEKLVPQLLHMRNMAQTRILGGVQDGLKEVTPLLKTFQPLVGKTSDVIGGLARDAGGMARELGPEMGRVLGTNVDLIDNLGHAAINLAIPFVRLLDAARPLTKWLGEIALGASQALAKMSNSGTKSGALSAFFARTQVVLTHVLSILGHLGGAFGNVVKAAWPLGHWMLIALDKGAAAFDKWTGSAEGMSKMGAFFEAQKEPLRAMAQLAVAVVKAFGGLSTGSGLAPMLDMIRTQLLPALVTLVAGTTAAFGPKLIQMASDAIHAFTPFFAQSGGISVYVAALSGFIKAAGWILNNVPGAAQALASLGVALAAMRIASMVAGLFTILTTAITAVTGSVILAHIHTALLVAQMYAIRAATAVWAAVTWLATGAMTALGVAMAILTSPITLVIAAIALVALGLYELYQHSETFRGAVNAVWSFIADNWKSLVGILLLPLEPIIQLITHFGDLKQKAGEAFGWIRDKASSLFDFFTGLPGQMTGVFSGMFDGLREAFKGAVNFIIRGWNSLQFKIPGFDPPGPGPKFGGITIGVPKIGELYTGGVGTGWNWVGEQGPELMNFGSPSRVLSTSDSAGALASAMPRVPLPDMSDLMAAARSPDGGGGSMPVLARLTDRGGEILADIIEDVGDKRAARR